MTENELRQNVINIANAWIGCTEMDGSHRKIIDTYNNHKPLARGYSVRYNDAWCATFVSAVAIKAGLTDIIPTECGCNQMIQLFKKLGCWVENDAYVPKLGDIIFYDWDDSGAGDNKGNSDHVGIVVSVNDGKIKVVEGNISDAVGYRTIAVNGRYIRGFGCPLFSSKATKSDGVKVSSSSNKESVFSMELKVLKKGSKGEQVKALQILLMGRGYTLPKYGADGDYGDETVKAVKALQKDKKIAQDGIAGKDTFSKLLLG